MPMSLIEYLEGDNWQEVLRRNFESALWLLKTDRYRMTSSAIDDLKSWLAMGGMNRVKEHLDRQMHMRRFSATKQAEINAFVDQLTHDHWAQLLDLMAAGILPGNLPELINILGLSETEFTTVWQQGQDGNNGLGQWLEAQGYTNEKLAPIYALIDQWLRENVNSSSSFDQS
jgi:hypothetical protein